MNALIHTYTHTQTNIPTVRIEWLMEDVHMGEHNVRPLKIYSTFILFRHDSTKHTRKREKMETSNYTKKYVFFCCC